MTDHKARLNRLGELNVIHQVYNLTLTPVVRQAWERGRRPQLARADLFARERPAQGTGARQWTSPEEADALHRTLYGA